MQRKFWSAVVVMTIGVAVGTITARATTSSKKEITPLRAGYVSATDMMQKWELWQQKAAQMNQKRQQKSIELTGLRGSIEASKGAAQRAQGEDKVRLDREVIDLQRRFEDVERSIRVEIDREALTILEEFYNKAQKTLAALAEERNLDVVYFCPVTPKYLGNIQGATQQKMDLYFRPPAMMPAYVRDGIDLTSELIEKLNQESAKKVD
jgi:Skp family chaperone for outer membrane proteins